MPAGKVRVSVTATIFTVTRTVSLPIGETPVGSA
jgi:hypothetical protein